MNHNDFKEKIHNLTIEIFEKNGMLIPMTYFSIEDNVAAIPIPSIALSDTESKIEFSETLKDLCMKPGVNGVAMVMEAYCSELSPDIDDEIINLIRNGAIKVSELSGKKDIICLIISSPFNEEIIMYEVDSENKTIGMEIETNGKTKGIFSGFFQWTQN